jgi:glycosyltransferase involved in cell wall biosynthesis
VLVNPEVELPPEIRKAKHLKRVPAPWDPHGAVNQKNLPPLLKKLGARLLHSLDVFGPIVARNVAHVITIHDLIPITCSDKLQQSKKTRFLPLWKAWLKLQAARASCVVAVSRHAANDVASLLRVPSSKIRVVYNPVREWGRVEAPETFRRRMKIEGRILSCVGRQDPYKNVAVIVRALPEIQRRLREPLKLVIAGPTDPRYLDAKQDVDRYGLSDRVLFTGWLCDADLGALYQASDVFVFPSLYEGFGIPPLEAMRFGTPVVASDRTSIPEVLGDAAILVNPESPSAIAEGVARVLKDPELAARLRAAGPKRAAEFSAERAAKGYLAVYREVLDGRHEPKRG